MAMAHGSLPPCVSHKIPHFRFVVIPIAEKAERLKLESQMISTVSLCDGCQPSAQWLGLSSPRAKIRESGLWLVNELYKAPLCLRDLERLSSGIILVRDRRRPLFQRWHQRTLHRAAY